MVATSSKRTLQVASQSTRKKARPSSPLPSESCMFSDVDLTEVYDQLLTQLEDVEDANAWRPSQSLSQVPRNAAGEDEVATPGRLHYSLRFMWRIVQRVLKSWEPPQAIEYWGDNLRALLRLFTLPVPAQHLFMRVLIRRRDWMNPTKLNYSDIGGDLDPLFRALWNRGFMETSKCSDSLPLDECLKLLQQPDIQSLAKKFHLDHLQGSQTLKKSLLKHANQRTVFGTSVGVNVLHHAKRLLGTCYRINTDTWNLMTAILTLYSPPMMDTSLLCDDPRIVLNQNLIFTMLQAETSKIQFPAPVLHKCTVFHPTLGHLMEYVVAKTMEQRMLSLMEKQEHAVVMVEAEQAKSLLENNHLTNEEKMLFYRETPYFLRRYTAAWVLTRCVSWGFESAQKLRNYEEAVRLLKFLLETEDLRIFCTNSRGAWYDRLALNLSAHLKRMEESLDACNRGLQDPEVHARDGLLLQDRALKIASKEGLQFEMKIPIREPKKLTIKGRTIGKNLGDQRNNHFYTDGDDDGVEQVSVEIVALKHFTEHRNFKEGVHAEGSAWHALFGLLCYDIVFDHSVPGVWLSELQTHPSDLNSRGLYENRRDRFEERFNDLATSSQEELFTRVRVNYDLHFGQANSEISWECFDSINQIQRFLSCCPPALLTAVFRRLVMDYRHARSGFPDLTVWNDETGALAVVEVKGPGDRLSTKQRLWLNFFEDNGVEALALEQRKLLIAQKATAFVNAAKAFSSQDNTTATTSTSKRDGTDVSKSFVESLDGRKICERAIPCGADYACIFRQMLQGVGEAFSSVSAFNETNFEYCRFCEQSVPSVLVMLESNATRAQAEEEIRKACSASPGVKLCSTLLKKDNTPTYEQVKSVFRDQSKTFCTDLKFCETA
ncbi:coiled-coil domain-containing protein MTMR15 [Aphelenchoides avenae]|nr:coiled-coil domain-containing protein MTMR15 [Aphelenchus avenae]